MGFISFCLTETDVYFTNKKHKQQILEFNIFIQILFFLNVIEKHIVPEEGSSDLSRICVLSCLELYIYTIQETSEIFACT